MAQQQHKAGYYYPHPKQDMWGFGLLMFSVFKGKGQLPHEHEKAMQDGTTLLFASKLCSKTKYTDWLSQVISAATSDSMNECVTGQADMPWLQSSVELVRGW